MLPCESLPAAVADRYADLKATQQRRGLSLDENDFWIAPPGKETDWNRIESDWRGRLVETGRLEALGVRLA
jgi:hypothetical protein